MLFAIFASSEMYRPTVYLEYGRKTAWLMYLATALVSVMLSADKESAFFYIFVGYYPILKARFDRIRPRVARAAAKAGYFALAIGAMYAFLYFVLKLDELVQEFQEAALAVNAVFYVLFAVCMLMYDFLLARFAVYYARVLRPKLKLPGK